MACTLVKYTVGLLVGLAAFSMPGCAKHTPGHGSLAVFGLVSAPGGQVRSAGWLVQVQPRGIFSLTTATSNRVGAFALNTVLSPGRYIFSLDKGNLNFKSPVILKRRAAWYQVVELKASGGLGGAPLGRKAISRGTVVFGLVTETNGNTPIAGATVGAMRSNSSRTFPNPRTATLTNKMGAFALGVRLLPGTYVVTALRGVFAAVARSTIVIKPSSGKWIVLRLRAASGSIRGRVLDDSGHPVAGVEVDLVGNTNHMMYKAKMTDRRGQYSINNVVPDEYIVQILGHGMTQRVVTVGKGRVTRNFTVPSGP